MPTPFSEVRVCFPVFTWGSEGVGATHSSFFAVLSPEEEDCSPEVDEEAVGLTGDPTTESPSLSSVSAGGGGTGSSLVAYDRVDALHPRLRRPEESPLPPPRGGEAEEVVMSR